MTDNARKTGAAVEAHFEFLMWLVPTVERFPRTQEFLIGAYCCTCTTSASPHGHQELLLLAHCDVSERAIAWSGIAYLRDIGASFTNQ